MNTQKTTIKIKTNIYHVTGYCGNEECSATVHAKDIEEAIKKGSEKMANFGIDPASLDAERVFANVEMEIDLPDPMALNSKNTTLVYQFDTKTLCIGYKNPTNFTLEEVREIHKYLGEVIEKADSFEY